MNAYRKILPAIYRQCGVDSRYYDHDPWMLCWNVKMHSYPSFESVWQKMCTPDFEYVNEAEALTRIPSYKALKDEWKISAAMSDGPYDHALDNMRSAFLDGDSYNFVSPAVEKKYSVEFPKNGANCKWGFMGRSAGWLVLREFMDSRIYKFYAQSGGDDPHPHLVDNWRLPYLLAMMEEVTAAVANRENELIYQLAFNMRYNMGSLVPE